MAYGDFKDLPRRTASDKVLRDKTFSINKNPKYDGYQRGLASMACKFIDERSAPGSGITIKNENISNQKLVKELHKPIIREIKKHQVYSSYEDNIWGADLADIQLINTFNKGICFCYVLLMFLVNMLGLFL